MTRTKMISKEKLPLEKWPQIFDRSNLPKIADNFMFLVLFAIFFFAFVEAPFGPILEESETLI